MAPTVVHDVVISEAEVSNPICSNARPSDEIDHFGHGWRVSRSGRGTAQSTVQYSAINLKSKWWIIVPFYVRGVLGGCGTTGKDPGVHGMSWLREWRCSSSVEILLCYCIVL